MSICDQLNLASWTTENNVGVSDNQEQHCEEPQVLCPAKIRTPKMPPSCAYNRFYVNRFGRNQTSVRLKCISVFQATLRLWMLGLLDMFGIALNGKGKAWCRHLLPKAHLGCRVVYSFWVFRAEGLGLGASLGSRAQGL